MINLEPVSGVKILSAYKEINQIRKGNIPVPRTVEFFISDVCNHKCLGCHSKSLHNTKTPFLDTKKTKQIIDEVAQMGVEGIEISGGGEPLLHPDIIEIIKYIKSKNMKVGLITNGTMIKDYMIPTLTKDLLFIRIAFDASFPETYNKVHGKNDFKLLCKNITKLVKYRNKHKGTTTIGLKYLVNEVNSYELMDAATLAKKLKVDYIQFKPLRNSPYSIKNVNGVGLSIALAKEKATPTFKVMGNSEKSIINQRCILNVLHPLIDASGNVYLCAFFQHRQNTHKIGNIYKSHFKDIWYSEKHRKAFLNNNYKLCNLFDCPFHKANEIVQEGIIKDRLHLEFI